MNGIVVTSELRGPVDLADVRRWRDMLHAAVREPPTGSAIRLLVDQTGYRSASLEAHRLVRTVLPDLLATYGMRPALADLLGNADVAVDPRPDRRVVACALVHHEVFKMAELDRLVGRADQRFFSDVEAARRWLAVAPRPVVDRPRRRDLVAAWEGGA